MSSASAEPAKPAAGGGDEEKAAAGELLYCGGTNFDGMNRKLPGGMQGNLVSPTRLRSLVGVDIRSVATGCGELFLRPPLSITRVFGTGNWRLPACALKCLDWLMVTAVPCGCEMKGSRNGHWSPPL
jgi:hypothetical protein